MSHFPTDIAKERAYEELKDYIDTLVSTWGWREITDWIGSIILLEEENE